MHEITQNLRMFTSLFLKFFRAPTDKLVEPIFTFNTSLEILNLKFNWVIKFQKSKFYNDAYGEF